MSVYAIVWSATLVALVVVLALAAMQVARALRELKRLQGRIAGYGELPVLTKLARAEADVARIEATVEKIEPLVERARAALAVIRRGPIPPELIAAAKNLREQIHALRMFASP